MGFFSKKKKILIVEDEIDIADGLRARLHLAGFSVVLASNGKEGVDKARSEKPDLIIMDMMMPIMDGFQACRTIKEIPKLQKTPIIVLTALPNVHDAEKAFSAGADDFLNKPFSNERLLQKIQKFIPPK